jgi:hypothetical protein
MFVLAGVTAEEVIGLADALAITDHDEVRGAAGTRLGLRRLGGRVPTLGSGSSAPEQGRYEGQPDSPA